jgi:CTP:molybdopterin cytidylyltransferase MocA
MGRPKALVDDWLRQAVDTLQDCDRIVVVLGAAAEQARALLAGRDVQIVVAEDWATGMSASLRAGLDALSHETRCLLTLVDLPDVGADVVGRVLAEPDTPAVLARASYNSVPGHPVLLGREHWDGARASATGDQGAREYLRAHRPVLVECGDLATGRDVDR